jgi:hypothetical protein
MESTLPLRPPEFVMKLERLGAFHQTRLSFVRSLMRQIAREQWQIGRFIFDLDDNGYGTAVYRVSATNDEIYSVVFFSQFISDEVRTDRVIAEKWDMTCVLCEGLPDEGRLAELRENVPKQEAGRNRTDVIVLCRANKSGRNFDAVVETLAMGKQPRPQMLMKAGYLVRTTAVYGNGKFGLADYAKVQKSETFSRSFSAQMFAVYMVRHFSLELVEHIASRKAPEMGVSLHPDIKRYIGVGNATGLGMAPFLIKHPRIIHQWLLARETALARILHTAPIQIEHFERLGRSLEKARRHFQETFTDDSRQQQTYTQIGREIPSVQAYLSEQRREESFSWTHLLSWAETNFLIETQELLVSLLMELYPELVDDLEDTMVAEETYRLVPEMPLDELKSLIETNYAWAIEIDFTDPKSRHYFWYRSAEKEEPRLGERFLEPGTDKEQQLAVGQAAAGLYAHLQRLSPGELSKTAVHFLLQYPRYKGIVRRVQSMAGYPYAEIRGNLIGADCLPINILRCKLSIFGASKFDPKSKLWTRITLFQGAPLVDDFENSTRGRPFADDWYFPVAPKLEAGQR